MYMMWKNNTQFHWGYNEYYRLKERSLFISHYKIIVIDNLIGLTILTLITIIIWGTAHRYHHIKEMGIILSCSCSNNFVICFKILFDCSKSIFYICIEITQYYFSIRISLIYQINIWYCAWTCVTNWDTFNWIIRSETIKFE